MTNEMKNIFALNAFKNSISKKMEHGNDGFMLNALVTYNALNKTFTEILEVYLITGGYRPMVQLDIFEKGKIITSQYLHLDFNPKYDNMTFRFNKNMLIIEGRNSPKIGDYEVIIEEK